MCSHGVSVYLALTTLCWVSFGRPQVKLWNKTQMKCTAFEIHDVVPSLFHHSRASRATQSRILFQAVRCLINKPKSGIFNSAILLLQSVSVEQINGYCVVVREKERGRGSLHFCDATLGEPVGFNHWIYFRRSDEVGARWQKKKKEKKKGWRRFVFFSPTGGYISIFNDLVNKLTEQTTTNRTKLP